VQGLVANLDGRQIVRVAAIGWSHEAEQLGQRLAREALHQGAGELR
jgi:porphobilinogen deaminase